MRGRGKRGAAMSARAMAMAPPDDAAFVTCNGAAVAKLRALLAQPGLLQVCGGQHPPGAMMMMGK